MQIKRPRILLVEDDLIQAKLIKRVLEKSMEDVMFTHVSSGEECLDLINNKKSPIARNTSMKIMSIV